MRDDDVRAVLERDVPVMPPSRVDPALAIRTARQRRRRTLAVAAAAVAVPVVVLAGAGAAVLTRPDRLPVTPAGPATAVDLGTAAPQPGTLTAPATFDPLVRTLEVGWHPATFTETSVDTATTRQSRAYNPPGPIGETGLYVALLARGRQFDPAERSYGMTGGEEPVAEPAAPIRGGTVVCLTASCASIRWQYDTDAWAWISYGGPGDAAAIARRVAASISLGGREAVRTPFRVTGRTAKLGVAATSLHRSSPGNAGDHGVHWSVTVTLAGAGARSTPWQPTGVQIDSMDRKASEGPLPNGKEPGANTTIDGGPAYVKPDGKELIRWGVKDTRLLVLVWDAPVTARAVNGDIRLVDRPADPSTWVSPV